MAELTPLKFEKNPDLWENLELESFFLPENRQGITELIEDWDKVMLDLSDDDVQNEVMLKKYNIDDAPYLIYSVNPNKIKSLLYIYDEIIRNETNIVNKESLLKSFTFLQSLDSLMQEHADWRYYKDTLGKEVNKTELSMKDNKIILRIRNLANTDLSFALTNDMSLIFSDNLTLTNKKIEALSCFFYDMGLSVSDFTTTAKLKVAEG